MRCATRATGPAAARCQRIRDDGSRGPGGDLQRENATVTGTAVRPTYRRSKHPIGDSAPGYVLTDGQGGVAGYLFDAPPDEPGERYWHDDSAGDSEQRLRILGMLARRHGCEGVCFHRLPFTSDLAAHLWRLDCTVTMEYRNDGGYLVRIVDLASTLRAMTGELADRLAKSHLAGWRGELLVRAGDQEAVLVIEGSRVRVRRQAGRPGKAGTAHRLEGDQHVAQLLVGTYPPLETVAAGGIALGGEARALVEVLFPPQYPQMPNEDL